MVGNIAMYFANRATQGAVGSLTRWASWGVAAGFFGVVAGVFAAISLYQALVPVYGSVTAAGAIAGGSLLLALVTFAVPAFLDFVERRAAARARAQVGPIATTIETVSTETAAAVDYFGPLQVVASAFLVGMRTGTQLRGLRRPAA